MRSKLALSLAFVAILCLNDGLTYAQVSEGETEKNTIAVEIGNEEGFATLATALEAAELTKVLEGKGPFTLFAPSEEAFKRFDAETLQDLLKDENRKKLVAVLKAHVASGNWTVEKISAVSEVPTVDGGSLTVTRKDEKLMVGSATIDLEKSLVCENGLIYCIDEVMPAK